MTMQFGWLTLALSPSPEEDAVRIDQQIEQVCSAEQLGFSDVWLTEHYFTGESVYNDALLFASALTRCGPAQIRIGFAVVQMPFHHPVRLAVQLALLDNLSKGRIDVGIGKGTVYNEYEFVGHGLRSDDSRERMEEAIEILERAWRETPLVYDGKYFQVQVPELRPQAGAAARAAALAQRHLARLVHRMRPARRADPDRPPAGGAHQGALGAVRGGPERRRPRRGDARAGCWRRARCGATSTSPNPMPRPRTSCRRCCCGRART